MEITGTLFAKMAKVNKTETFAVQEFILDCKRYDPNTGQMYENFVKFQVTNAAITALEAINLNDKVKVSFAPNGRFFKDADGKDKHAQNLNAYKFEKIA